MGPPLSFIAAGMGLHTDVHPSRMREFSDTAGKYAPETFMDDPGFSCSPHSRREPLLNRSSQVIHSYMTREIVQATALVEWAWRTLSLLLPVPAGAVVHVSPTNGGLAPVSVTVGGITTGFGLDLDLPNEELLGRFVYFLSDALAEESGNVWPPCPSHGDRHAARISWVIQAQCVSCFVNCERDVAFNNAHSTSN